jgi:hypothetical protein
MPTSLINLTAAALASTVLAVPAAEAAFIDTFDTTVNIDPRDNRSDATVSGSVVSLTLNNNFPLTQAGSAESVVDYFVGAEASTFNANNPGATTFSLANESVFETVGLSFINPDGEDDIRLIIRAFFYDASNSFVGPAAILRPANAFQDETDISVDVSTVAPTTAVGYTLGLSLIKPGGGAVAELGDGVSFDTFSFTAIPEPTSAAALGLLGLTALRRRRA